ncbi:SPFH domain-containing protein [uncultured Paracoccus sp.]|uniref:SPFH domain-containing protein n=1 Tax=uncultured Paracoccus sp. TaxID=189685 RepID=UPI002638D8C9|nr:SPFH domain-containing protein [uncultured Paracoccus sp.]
MPIIDFLTGEFIDVIEWTDDTRDTMVWRFQTRGNAIKYGAKLTVREGQAAVFVHEGQIADVFGPGLYMLETNNMPVLTRLQHWHHGFRSPFKSEIYFVNTTRFNNLKWGTRNPIIARDPEFGPVRLRAFGTYSMRVTDPARFMAEIVGTDGEFTSDEISFQLRNIIVQEFSRMIAGSGIPVLDMAANTQQLGEVVARAIAPAVGQYGLTIPEFYIENISLPDEVEKMLDKRTSIGIVGDLDRFSQYAQGEAMLNASTRDGGMGAGLGAGMGAALGMGMGARQLGWQQGPWGTAAQPMPSMQPQMQPPPQPGMIAAQATTPDTVWHVAIDGAAQGPFGRSDLGRMMKAGQFTRDTLVWAPGQDGWLAADEVPALAQLFTMLPPPLPAQPPSPPRE